MRLFPVCLITALICFPYGSSAQGLALQSFLQLDCFTIYGMPSRTLYFVDEHTAVYTVYEKPPMVFNAPTPRVSTDTIDYRYNGDSILFFSRIDTAYMARRAVRIEKQSAFTGTVWKLTDDYNSEDERLRLTNDSIVLDINLSSLLQSYGSNFSLHLVPIAIGTRSNKQEMYTRTLREPHTHISIPGNHFVSRSHKVQLVLELRYHMSGEQHYVVARDTMNAYDYHHFFRIDFDPPVSPFPFQVLYRDHSTENLYFRRPESEDITPCGHFARVGHNL